MSLQIEIFCQNGFGEGTFIMGKPCYFIAFSMLFRYLVWTEQNCVKGGKENNLEKLLENYLKQFTEEKRYHNDPRYVSAWIRYVSLGIVYYHL